MSCAARSAGISWGVVTKLSKSENISMDVMVKICKALDCNIGDIVDVLPNEIKTEEN
jgi:DNA-binding Xre family transcriptional regulator